MENLRKLLPPLTWLPVYDKRYLKWDLLAGVSLAFFVIPESMAYARLAGLPPETGIYCYVFAGLLYFFFGTFRQAAVGPTSAISLVIGTSVAVMAGGDISKAMLLASMTTILMAAMFFLAYLVRLSALVNFISETILLGFKSGAALLIASTQLPLLFGLSGSHGGFVQRISFLVMHFGEMNFPTLFIGMVALALLIAGHHLFPGKPVSLVVVILSILFVTFFPAEHSGVRLVGEVPAGLPKPSFFLPSFDQAMELAGLALAAFLLSYIESISAARIMAQKNGYEIDPRQELFALGAANLASGIGQGYAVASGLSQSTVNDRMGAKSPLSGVTASIVLLLFLYFLTRFFRNLPEVILAAIVIHAVLGLIKIRELRHLFSMSHAEFFISILALVAVLVLGILQGVIIAAAFSLIFLVKRAASPNVAELGRIPGTNRFSDLERHPDNLRIDGVKVFRIEAAIFYINTEYIHDHLRKSILQNQVLPQLVVLDLSASIYVDVSGSMMLLHLEDELEKKGIGLRIINAHSEARDILRRAGMENEIGHISRKLSIMDVIDEFNEAKIRSSREVSD